MSFARHSCNELMISVALIVEEDLAGEVHMWREEFEAVGFHFHRDGAVGTETISAVSISKETAFVRNIPVSYTPWLHLVIL